MRLDHFMARANALYYANHDPFADFTTAPEIAQMFGEILGAWSATVWRQMGGPSPMLWVEAGPGRGTLMTDATRALTRVAPAFLDAARLHLVETSPRLRALQARSLPHATWHAGLETLPPGPLILLANEFLDALPIRQFVRRGQGFTERHVEAGQFTEHAGSPPLPLPETVPEGAVIELNEAALAFTTALAQRIAQQGGAALLLDYGPAQSAAGESLQALHAGAPADPLVNPGAADLTAHVDFARLADAARAAGAMVRGPLPQGALLERLGLYVRAGRLAAGTSPRQALGIMQAAQRLAAPERMGSMFKAIVLHHPSLPTPPGFEA